MSKTPIQLLVDYIEFYTLSSGTCIVSINDILTRARELSKEQDKINKETLSQMKKLYDEGYSDATRHKQQKHEEDIRNNSYMVF